MINSCILIILCVLLNTYSVSGKKYSQNGTPTTSESRVTTTVPYDYEYETFPTDFEIPKPNATNYNCEGKTCVRKCCPKGYLLDFEQFDCKEVNLFNVTNWESSLNDITLIYDRQEFIMNFVHDDNYTCSQYNDQEFHLNEDGDIYHYDLKQSFSYETYCIDKTHEEGVIRVQAIICHRKEVKSYFIMVTDEIYFAAILISCCFIFLILLIQAVSSANMDLQKKCTISLCVNLFTGYVLLIINNTSYIKQISTSSCVSIGISTQFFFLAFYFWLNIMCYEISRIIRGTFRLQTRKTMIQSPYRYFYYCAYCWGCPLFVCIITVVMQIIPLKSFPQEIRPYIIKPRISHGRCWFEDSLSVYVYYYILEISLHIANVLLMGYTTYLLHRERLIFMCCRRKVIPTALRTHASINYLNVFMQQLKIFIMYLFLWIMNTMSLIHKRESFWRIVDITVALQGVFLFCFVYRSSKVVFVSSCYARITNIGKEFSNRITEQKTTQTSQSILIDSSSSKESRL